MTPLFLLAGLSLGQVSSAQPARVTVLLPSEAQLYVHGRLCDLTSDTRSFNTPPLEPGRDYFYVLRATLEREGRTIDVSKKVRLRAGKRSVVDFGDLGGEETARTPEVGQPAARADAFVVPRGAAPMLSVARMEGDTLILAGSVVRMVPETRTKRVKDGEGNAREVNYTVMRPVFEWIHERVDPRTVQILDVEGKAVAAERLPGLLPRAAVVLASMPGQTVNPMYRSIFDRATLLLVRSPQPVRIPPPPPAPRTTGTDAPPSAPPPPPTLPAQGPPPRLFLARIDNQGNLLIRSCDEQSIPPANATEDPPGAAQGTFVRMMVREVPASQIKVHDGDGQEVGAAELPRLLREEKVVLAAMDGKKVDPFYLRGVTKGTLVLVPSAEHQRFFTHPFAIDNYGWGYGTPIMSVPAASPVIPVPVPVPTPSPRTAPGKGPTLPPPAAPIESKPRTEPAPPPSAPPALPPGDGQKPPVPKGRPFQVVRATAAEADGSVLVHVEALQALPRQRTVDGKPQTYMDWIFAPSKPLVLGKQARAFRPDGKAAQPAEVLKALARPTAAACFVRFGTADTMEPDSFYLSVLRADSVALVVDSADLFPPRPPAGPGTVPPPAKGK